MHVFEIVIALLLAGAGLSGLARRIGAPYPALVALAGAVLAVVPGTPVLLLDPQLALALFVAPVLLDAAFDASPRDLRENWRSIAGLAVGAVVLTVVAVAAVARAIVPAMTWPVAVALGAIVAPPDAAAATAVLKQLRPPHRLLVILEGESLFNDASSLLIYRLALDAAAGAVLSSNALAVVFGATVGSVVLAFIASRVMLSFAPRISEIGAAVIVQFCGTFAVWLIAERLHLSGILTTVVYAMLISRKASDLIPARTRIPSYAVWEVTVFVLNVLAFILVGLQLKPILEKLDWDQRIEYAWFAGAVCVTAVAARFAWVLSVMAFRVWRCRPRAGRICRQDPAALQTRAAALAGWCGMRGMVTLAAALALPDGGGAGSFPHRDLILFTSFAVVLGTLVFQGLTLRPIMMWLQLEDDGSVQREITLARVATIEAALAATGSVPDSDTVQIMRQRYDLQLRRANAETNNSPEAGSPQGLPSSTDVDAVRTALKAQRQKLLALRAEGTIGDTAFQQVEQELDWREIDLEQFFQWDQLAG